MWGPGPAGGPQDREFVAMDGRTMVLRWLNPEVQSGYGTGVYVRCGAEGASRKNPRQAAMTIGGDSGHHTASTWPSEK